MKKKYLILTIFFATILNAQFQSYETDNMRLIYPSVAAKYLVPHMARSFENAWTYHQQLFRYTPEGKVTILMVDFEDYGNGGAEAIPRNFISIYMAPFSRTYETVYGNDRVNWVMNHEVAHVVTMDQAAGRDNLFRSIFGGKVYPDAEQPLSAIYTYLATPRRYAPRWYYEGSAVFLETWMSGGLGRTFSAYYEMVFRTMVRDSIYFYDVVGLESEGTTSDFQVGANSYLYGSRFMAYLGNTYGPEKFMDWLARREGSKASFSAQFKKVYNISLDDAWSEWIEWEQSFQRSNLDSLRVFPASPYKELTERPLGSASRGFYHPETRKLYVGINYLGETPHIGAVDIADGSIEKICEVPGAGLYYVTSLAFNGDNTLFYTTDNSGFRDLMAVDIENKKSRELIRDARVGDLAYNRADSSLWGTRHELGLKTLVRIPYPYEEWNQVFTYDYGYELYDIDISPDGKWLTGAYSNPVGREKLIRMDTEKLLQKDTTSTVIFDFENSSPANFQFSADGRYLYGSSYYSGVSNIYKYDMLLNDIFIISNTETGLFRPTPVSDDSLIAMRYTGQGLQPVMIPNKALNNVNAINFLGNEMIANHPVLKEWIAPPPSVVNLDSVNGESGTYDVINNLSFVSGYPIVEKYKDSPAVGLRLHFSDRVMLSDLKISASYSPDADLPADERLHFAADFRYWNWQVKGWYNKADFYDFFGPTRKSRKGYGLSLKYAKTLDFQRSSNHSRSMSYAIETAGFGGLDELPYYQDVAATFSEAIYLNGEFSAESMVKPLGTLEHTHGVEWQLKTENSFINRKIYPHISSNLSLGVQLFSNSSLWLRSAAGIASGDRDNPFANFFFGGFGNNWVDHRDYLQYRHYESFPGLEINEIGGTNFAKSMLEWTLPPLRFRRLGLPGFYTRWARLALFGGGIVTNLDSEVNRLEAANLGAQLDFNLVVFSALNSYLSFGYAAAFRDGFRPSKEFMVSLKLL